mgnify:CR=1 FL=1|jgi:hypothetical protein
MNENTNLTKILTVNIIGGLGNQMFQYAFGYALSKENNAKIKLEVSGFDAYDLRNYALDLFNVEKNSELKSKYDFLLNKINSKHDSFLSKASSNLLRRLLRLTNFYYQEKEEFVYDQGVFNIKKNTYFYGYWQNEKYFKKYRNDLLEIFKLKDIHSQTKEYQQKIIKSTSVSLHIRREDFLNSIHDTCDIEYYKKAVLEILKIKKQAHFFIFSDDMHWVKNNLNFINHKTLILLESEIPDHEEMYLMSQCKCNIIANSSFSWWGAWLNQNSDKKVIAPKKWLKSSTFNTNDLIPASWVRL